MSMFDEDDFDEYVVEEYGQRGGRAPERGCGIEHRGRYEASPPRLRSKMYGSSARRMEPAGATDAEKIEYMASRLKALETRIDGSKKRESLSFGARVGGHSDKSEFMDEIADMKAKVSAKPTSFHTTQLEDKVEFLKEKLKQTSTDVFNRIDALERNSIQSAPFGARQSSTMDRLERKVEHLKDQVRNATSRTENGTAHADPW